jgi:hypothetical protein
MLTQCPKNRQSGLASEETLFFSSAAAIINKVIHKSWGEGYAALIYYAHQVRLLGISDENY